MGRPPRLTSEQKEQIIRDARSGRFVAVIAKEYGITSRYIYRLLAAAPADPYGLAAVVYPYGPDKPPCRTRCFVCKKDLPKELKPDAGYGFNGSDFCSEYCRNKYAEENPELYSDLI